MKRGWWLVLCLGLAAGCGIKGDPVAPTPKGAAQPKVTVAEPTVKGAR